jgi:arginyl-tRNA synthetase
LENEGRQWFAKLENGDQEAREIWQKCVDISLAEFNRVYDLLGVKIDNAHGEAFFENMLPEIVEDLKQAGLTKVSNGALIVEFSDMSPAILLKSDGATTYFTRDLATIKYRVNKWKPDKVVYEVGSEQILHFRQVFRAAEMMGWVTPGSLYHLPHGLLRWSSGKFSTRSGDTIHLADVIEKAMTEAQKIAPENSEKAIKTVAIGAIKFNDLSSDPRKDVVFDWERVMSMEGSSGPYLQYTYARCASLLRKKQFSNQQVPKEFSFDENELPLLRYFYIFNEKIVEAGERMSPAVIAEYLLDLARKYNEFYAKCRIVGEPEEERRLFLTQVTAKIIKEGLGILGIETLEKM